MTALETASPSPEKRKVERPRTREIPIEDRNLPEGTEYTDRIRSAIGTWWDSKMTSLKMAAPSAAVHFMGSMAQGAESGANIAEAELNSFDAKALKAESAYIRSSARLEARAFKDPKAARELALLKAKYEAEKIVAERTRHGLETRKNKHEAMVAKWENRKAPFAEERKKIADGFLQRVGDRMQPLQQHREAIQSRIVELGENESRYSKTLTEFKEKSRRLQHHFESIARPTDEEKQLYRRGLILLEKQMGQAEAALETVRDSLARARTQERRLVEAHIPLKIRHESMKGKRDWRVPTAEKIKDPMHSTPRGTSGEAEAEVAPSRDESDESGPFEVFSESELLPEDTKIAPREYLKTWNEMFRGSQINFLDPDSLDTETTIGALQEEIQKNYDDETTGFKERMERNFDGFPDLKERFLFMRGILKITKS